MLLFLISLLCFCFVLSSQYELKHVSGNEIRSEQRIGFFLSPWVIITQEGHKIGGKDIEWDSYEMNFNILCWSTIILAAGILALIGGLKMPPCAASRSKNGE